MNMTIRFSLSIIDLIMNPSLTDNSAEINHQNDRLCQADSSDCDNLHKVDDYTVIKQ